MKKVCIYCGKEYDKDKMVECCKIDEYSGKLINVDEWVCLDCQKKEDEKVPF